MAKKKIRDFFPQETETVLVQAHVDVELHHKVKEQMKDDLVTWTDLITAALKSYLEEKKAS